MKLKSFVIIRIGYENHHNTCQIEYIRETTKNKAVKLAASKWQGLTSSHKVFEFADYNALENMINSLIRDGVAAESIYKAIEALLSSRSYGKLIYEAMAMNSDNIHHQYLKDINFNPFFD